MHDFAVHADRLDGAVGFFEDGAARGFVDAPAFHADIAVFQQVDPADTVLAAEDIELGQQLGRRQALAVDRYGIPFFEFDFDIFGLVRSILGTDGELVHLFRGLGPGVFQDVPLEGDVQQVAIRAPGKFLAGRHRDAVLFRIFFQGGAAFHGPLAPGSDDLDRRVEVVVGDLEANLVVALAGGAVGNGVGAFLGGDFHLRLGDQRPGDGGAEEVATFVNSIGAEHGEDEVAGEFFFKVDDVTAAGAGFLGLCGNAVEFFTLAEVGGVGDHFAVVLFGQPFEDNGGVQAPGIGEDDFFDGGFLGHDCLLG